MTRPIYGLVLAGGQSRRMGRDKALLSYDGAQNQLEHTTELLQPICEQVYISQRNDQSYPLPDGTDAILDERSDFKGPLCGILSAMNAHPNVHWLVVACDLPHLKSVTLKKLVTEFQSNTHHAIAYRNSNDGLPEPLCAIYPAGSSQELSTLARELKTNSPRKLLIELKATLIQQDDRQSLNNINTPEAFEKAIGKIK